MIANLDNLSANPGLHDVFDLGDKIICHPSLAARFGSTSVKMPAKIVATTTIGLLHEDVVIVTLPDKHGEAEWTCKESSVMNLLNKGEAWLFTAGHDTNPNLGRGVAANLLKRGTKVSRLAVAVVPQNGTPFQAYYFRKES